MKQATLTRIYALLDKLIQSGKSREGMIASADECDGKFEIQVNLSGAQLSVDLDVALRVVESGEREAINELKSILPEIGPIESEISPEYADKVIRIFQWRASLKGAA